MQKIVRRFLLIFSISLVLVIAISSANASFTVSSDWAFDTNSGDVRVHTGSTLPFTTITLDATSVTFNTTSFNVTSSAFTNISIVYLHPNVVTDTTILTFDTNATATVNFTLGGFQGNRNFLVSVDNVSWRTFESDESGFIVFSYDSWSIHRFSISMLGLPSDSGSVEEEKVICWRCNPVTGNIEETTCYGSGICPPGWSETKPTCSNVTPPTLQAEGGEFTETDAYIITGGVAIGLAVYGVWKYKSFLRRIKPKRRLTYVLAAIIILLLIIWYSGILVI